MNAFADSPCIKSSPSMPWQLWRISMATIPMLLNRISATESICRRWQDEAILICVQAL